MSVRPPRHLGTVAAVASLTGTSGAEPAESASIAVVDPNKAAIAGRPAAWSDPNEPSNHLTFNRQYPRVRGDVHLTTVQVLAVRPNPERVLAAGSDSRPALAPVWEPAWIRIGRCCSRPTQTPGRPMPVPTCAAGRRRAGLRRPARSPTTALRGDHPAGLRAGQRSAPRGDEVLRDVHRPDGRAGQAAYVRRDRPRRAEAGEHGQSAPLDLNDGCPFLFAF